MNAKKETFWRCATCGSHHAMEKAAAACCTCHKCGTPVSACQHLCPACAKNRLDYYRAVWPTEVRDAAIALLCIIRDEIGAGMQTKLGAAAEKLRALVVNPDTRHEVPRNEGP